MSHLHFNGRIRYFENSVAETGFMKKENHNKSSLRVSDFECFQDCDLTWCKEFPAVFHLARGTTARTHALKHPFLRISARKLWSSPNHFDLRDWLVRIPNYHWTKQAAANRTWRENRYAKFLSISFFKNHWDSNYIHWGSNYNKFLLKFRRNIFYSRK